MKKITVIILTKNEERFLPGCLESLQWADEILVIDAYSTDGTIEIAKKFGARVISHEWKGFPEQRNYGAAQAQGEWLLYVDADERVSKTLRQEIIGLLNNQPASYSSYRLPHKNIIMGKWLKYGGWYPEYQHRLINKTSLKAWRGELHEHPEVEGKIGVLKGDLVHLTHRGIEWMLTKTIRYVRMEAELRFHANHPKVKIHHLFSAPFREFCYRAIKMQGYRDGIIGWIEIIYQSFNHFLIMVWLWEMQQSETMQQIYERLDKEYKSSEL
jgi:glycosyltransferase involved in cell wall biosynthesis